MATDYESIADWYLDGEDFEAELDEAQSNAQTEWEETFLDSIRARWQEYGMRAALTERQFSILRKLAQGES